MRNVGETLSSNPNTSQTSNFRVDWFCDIHDWADTYKVTQLKRRNESIILNLEGERIPSH